MQAIDPHSREAAAAVAGMAETYGWTPSPGDVVRCEPPFVGGITTGVVRATNGTYCLVSIGEDTLAYYPRELWWTGKRVEG